MNEKRTSSGPGANPVAHLQVQKRCAVRCRIAGLAGVAVGAVAAMVLLNRSPVPGARISDRPPAQQEHAVDVAPRPQPIADTAAPGRRRQSVVPNRAAIPARRPAGSATVEAADAVREPSPAGRDAYEEDSDVKLVASDVMRVADAISGMSPADIESPPVTITGCLEISTSGDEFRLTDTQGAGAPTSRGWRTGFLKKRTLPVALVEASEDVPLKAHVGKRVAATGLLATRELKVSALHVVDPTCD